MEELHQKKINWVNYSFKDFNLVAYHQDTMILVLYVLKDLRILRDKMKFFLNDFLKNYRDDLKDSSKLASQNYWESIEFLVKKTFNVAKSEIESEIFQDKLSYR